MGKLITDVLKAESKMIWDDSEKVRKESFVRFLGKRKKEEIKSL